MTDYIKREDALKAVDDIVCDADDAERTCDRIIDIPSADVAPVRRGRWITKKIEEPSGIGYRVICSCCNRLSLIGKMALYCPNCGAKMDEEDTND